MVIRPDENTARSLRADMLQWMQQDIRAEVHEFGPLVPRCLTDILALTADNSSDEEVEQARKDCARLLGYAKAGAAKIEADAEAGVYQPTPETATLSDHLIVAAVRFMCSRDDDLAAKKNRVGWNQADSGKGHVANALIKSGKRDLGVAIGRSIVGRYLKTQLAHMLPKNEGEAA